MPDHLQDVQRVAVRRAGRRGPAAGAPSTGVTATWLRHGEEPRAALRRPAPDGSAEPDAPWRIAEVTSVVAPLEQYGLRVHAIGFSFTDRPEGSDVEGEGEVEGGQTLPDEAPPLDWVDHLAGDTRAAAGDGAGAGNGAQAPPMKVQRTGAYAVVLDGENILLTRLRRTRMWTLPGGGIDFGEHPRDAVVREVYEESGLALDQVRLVDVSSNHWTGRAPYGRLEDFHAVRVLYRATVPASSVPAVVEVGGSTEEVAWIRLDSIDDLDIGQTVHLALRHLR